MLLAPLLEILSAIVTKIVFTAYAGAAVTHWKVKFLVSWWRLLR